MAGFIDLTGQRFGRLTVVRRGEDYMPHTPKVQVRWVCICDCGKECLVRTSALRRGETLSCGCYHSDVVSQKKKRSNKIRIDGSDVYVLLHNSDKEMVTDLETWERSGGEAYCWGLANNGYAKARVNGKTVNFHVFAFPDCPDGLERDHIDGNRINNRKNNVRFVTRCNNNKNRAFAPNRKSGRTGVNWSKASKKWRAFIKADNRYISLGFFSDLDEAIKAREAAEIQYYGEYRRK